jgi:hypothetical protein
MSVNVSLDDQDIDNSAVLEPPINVGGFIDGGPITVNEESDDELAAPSFLRRSVAKQPIEGTILCENSSSDDDADFTFTFDGRPLKRTKTNTEANKTAEVIDISSSSE